MLWLQYIKRSPALIVSLIALVAATCRHGHGNEREWPRNQRRSRCTPGPCREARTARPAGIPGPARVHRTSGTEGRPRRAGSRRSRGAAGAAGAAGAIGPSDGFVKQPAGGDPLPAGADTVVAQLSLTPASNYIVTAATELGNNSGGSTDLVSCMLLENFNPIGGGSAFLPAMAVFAQTVTLTAATTGGTIKLSCNPGSAGQARATA